MADLWTRYVSPFLVYSRVRDAKTQPIKLQHHWRLRQKIKISDLEPTFFSLVHEMTMKLRWHHVGSWASLRPPNVCDRSFRLFHYYDEYHYFAVFFLKHHWRETYHLGELTADILNYLSISFFGATCWRISLIDRWLSHSELHSRQYISETQRVGRFLFRSALRHRRSAITTRYTRAWSHVSKRTTVVPPSYSVHCYSTRPGSWRRFDSIFFSSMGIRLPLRDYYSRHGNRNS